MQLKLKKLLNQTNVNRVALNVSQKDITKIIVMLLMLNGYVENVIDKHIAIVKACLRTVE